MSDDRFAFQRTQVTRVGRLRTALMLTDIVGYSRRMHEDESKAVTELRQHNQLIREKLETFHGREVKTIGDAFLAEFPVADDALNCALAIQQAMGQAFTGEDALRIRIGLHVAEVEAIGPDVIGDGVNILSRIEPQAQPGGICASKVFLDEVPAKPVLFFSMGPVEMKNIDAPMELFAWPLEERAMEETDATPEPPPQAEPLLPPTRVQRRAALIGPPEDENGTEIMSAIEPATLDEGGTGPTTALPKPVFPPRPSSSASLPARPNARPLSKSSGIFAPRHEEPFPETATVVVPDGAGTALSDVPSLGNPLPATMLSEVPSTRELQETLDAPASEDAIDTGPGHALPGARPAADSDPTDLPGPPHPDDEPIPEVRIPPPHKPRGGLVIVGSIAGGVFALTLVAIGWIVGHAAKKQANPEATVTTVVHVAPKPPEPAPPPAPVVVATPPPAPPPKVEEAPKPAAPTLEETVAKARANLEHDKKLKPKKRKALVGELNKLEHKWKKAREGKDKKKSEHALREYLKKHHLP